MKTVFVQQGIENAGKSTTIYMLYKLLIRAHPDAVLSDIKSGKPPFVSHSDVRAVIKIGSFIIGIESQGDPWCRTKRLEKSLGVFLQLECDVVVCATRTWGKTATGVMRLEEHGYHVIWRERPREASPASQGLSNRREARWMFDQIEEILLAAAA